MRVAEIIAALPSLSKPELAAVKAAADRLLVGPVGTATPLYEALQAVARVRLPYDRFIKSKAGQGWPERQKQAMTFVQATWPELPKVQKQPLLRFLLSLLADDLKRRNITVSMGTMALNVGELPRVVDQSFPGYRLRGESASLMLKAMVRK